MSDPQRVVVLLSGRGSNLAAILDHPGLRPHVVGAIASRPSAPGLDIARQANLPIAVNHLRDFSNRAAADAAILHTLEQWQADWIVLAGWMRILDEHLVRSFPGRIVNIHPSLLPLFPGLHPQQQAIDAGASTSGCTVHLVIPGPVDGGPILAQAPVAVLPTDDADALSRRILAEEHRLYPDTLARLLNGEFAPQIAEACQAASVSPS